jgi:molybdopterin molybdotransferase
MALLESLGVVLAEDVVATAAVPAFDVAAVDGYAVRASDALGDAQWSAGRAAPGDVRLHVIGDLTAISWEPATVSPGASYTVTAGSPLPVGADAVVPTNATDGGLATVQIRHAPEPGDGVRLKASTLAPGAVLATSGSRVTASTIALLAAAGIESVLVAPPPRVIVAATGDELVHGARLDLPGRVLDVDSVSLAAAAREAGAAAHRVGIVPDEDEALRLLVEDHAHRTDLLVTTGGTQTDLGRRFGPDVRFVTVASEPPLVLGYGRVGPGRIPVICLPGDPAGALLGFELLLRPLIRKLAGAHSPFRPSGPVKTASALRSASGVREFRPARLLDGDFAQPLPGGEAYLTGYATATALLVIDEVTTDVEAGTELPALLLEPGAG